jgi:molybdopterin synthase sulfur carrier subunit
MMTITVKFFASLGERTGLTETTIEAGNSSTVMDAWNTATGHQAMPANTLCAINMNYAQTGDGVHDGDEIAFFPPVTGGSQ